MQYSVELKENHSLVQEPTGMTSEATVRNRLYSRHLNVAVFLVLSAVCGLRSASAQHTQSQRRLSPAEGPQGPIEQMRLLMHLQHLQSQFLPTDAPTEQSGTNSLAERPAQLERHAEKERRDSR